MSEPVRILGIAGSLRRKSYNRAAGPAQTGAIRLGGPLRNSDERADGAGKYEALIEYEKRGRDAMLSVPTLNHYLPLVYVLGARRQGESVSFPVEGIDGSSVSMLAVRIG